MTTVTTPTNESFILIGLTPDRRRALGLHDSTDGAVYVLTRTADDVFYGPRWECSAAHWDAHRDLYADRFPTEPSL